MAHFSAKWQRGLFLPQIMPAKEKATSDESELQTSGCVAQIYTSYVVQVF